LTWNFGIGNIYRFFNNMQLKRNLESAALVGPANNNDDNPTGMIATLENKEDEYVARSSCRPLGPGDPVYL